MTQNQQFAPRFAVGDPVLAVAFIDCFGRLEPEKPGLTVTDVRRVEQTYGPAYFRYTASGEGCRMVEGAEQFFTEAIQ